MNSNELRRTFLSFFEEKGHKVIPSSSLIPLGDPTLLLTSAGMVQFKPYFTGDAIPPSPRLASCQKCFRVTDIDEVGDSKHLTFFEMLGNFSIGDYFKKEAIAWAWEFVMDRLNLARERLIITIFQDDNVAFQCWRQIGIPAERIIRFGEEHNFWGPAGDTGPCGPCSEIHYDLGESAGCGSPDCGPNCRCGRFSEIWNLVFTQYDQQLDGSRILLPKPNIDTGMGFERVAAVMQGKTSVYETDLFIPLIQCITDMTGKRYSNNDSDDRALRIVAEHGRSITFLLADGVIPSNEGRGYVLRRVLRRAALFGRRLGLNKPFLTQLARVTISSMGSVYPELNRERDYIFNTIEAEESRFNQTLDVGLNILDDVIEDAKRSGSRLIGGGDVFRLYDTYGFPKEITAEIAANNGLSLDLPGFQAEMERQRERARAAHKVFSGENQFAVHNNIETKSRFLDDRFCHRSQVTYLEAEGVTAASAGRNANVRLILTETPFYGEMGGQVGDIGEIHGTNGNVLVTNAIRTGGDTTIHYGKVMEGTIAVGDFVDAVVEEERRLDITRNHTATHLLQAALRQILGKHVRQSGSLVAPDYLRFDFTHRSALTRQQLSDAQRIVNDIVRRDLEVICKVMPYQQALDQGALAFFGEKYGGEVRMLQIGDPPISLELCGGTHVKWTGEIGFFQIMTESSIGSGIRRIEAATGRGAEAFIEERLILLHETAEELGSPLLEVKDRIAALNIEVEAQRKKAQSLELKLLRNSLEPILSKAESVGGITVVAAQVAASDMNTLREICDLIKQRLSSVLVVLAAVYDGRPNFVAMATPDLVKKGLHAGEIVRQVASVTGGGGGGKAELGQAGGKDIGRIDDALKLVRELVAGHVNTGA